MSIITYPLNGVVYSAEDVATYLCTRTSGVYSEETNFAVSTTGTRQIDRCARPCMDQLRRL